MRYSFAFTALILGLSFSIFHFPFSIPSAHAAPLTFRHKHFLFSLNSASYPQWRAPIEHWTYDGMPVTPDPSWRVDGDAVPALPAGVERTVTQDWNTAAIRTTLEKIAAAPLHRDAGNVVIKKTSTGGVVFEGVGLPGRAVQLDSMVAMTIEALNRGVADIELPVTETPPTIRVEDAELAASGIKEVVTVGESDFTGSPVNRKHNIGVGLRRFNGTLIPANSDFSFNKILGAVDASTGYRKELVIKGDRTEPDYGGGLCQISTTAYRGIWEYGFPIPKRKNHSYTVRYYAPPGTDATVYPGSVDMIFTNDSPGALLIQTHQEKDNAYFIYYGTKDDRSVMLAGPFVTGRREPPPDKIELTTDLAPGEKKKLNARVPGLTAVWYRAVDRPQKLAVKPEKVVSIYEARPLFTQVGVAALPEGYAGPAAASDIPTFTEDMAAPETASSSSSR